MSDDHIASTSHVRFLSTQNVVDLHAATIARHGGRAGLRDLALLEAAVAIPAQTFGGELLHPDLTSQAGAYLFHVAQSHAFVDGNKRAALGACLAFLRVNGADWRAENGELMAHTLAVASGELGKAEVIAWWRQRVVLPRRGP